MHRSKILGSIKPLDVDKGKGYKEINQKQLQMTQKINIIHVLRNHT